MKSLKEQKDFYQKCWDENHANLAKETGWVPDPLPLYTIEVRLPERLWSDMERLISEWKGVLSGDNHLWLLSEELHITLQILGHEEVDLTTDDVKDAVDRLEEVCRRVKPFEITLGNISCFPSVPFREVYCAKGNLYQLHKQIADMVPWCLHSQYQYENYNPHLSIFYPGSDVSFLFGNKSFSRELKPDIMMVDSVYLTRWYDGEGILEKEDIIHIPLGSG